MAKKNSERDELRLVQRSWGAYQPLAQTRADFVNLLKLLGREGGGRRGRFWGSLRLSKAEDAAGYLQLRIKVHVIGPEHALAALYEKMPNLHQKERRRHGAVDVPGNETTRMDTLFETPVKIA